MSFVVKISGFGTKALSFKGIYLTENGISAPIDMSIIPAETHFKNMHYTFKIYGNNVHLLVDMRTENMRLHSQPIWREMIDLILIYLLLYFSSRDMNASIHTSPPPLWGKKCHVT